MNFKERIEDFKQNLAMALDDDLHTRQWHNLVDYLIVFMILLSTIEIFLSTFHIHPTLRKVLVWIDIATLLFFTVEVSLRIWIAPLIDPKYHGFKGRLKYCFSFYGAIDVLSTFPFYLQWLFPLPIAAFKILRTARVVRLFRISRYMKSFRLLTGAVAAKRHELFISMQFLIIITVILSLLLFFAEHEVQPEVYDNGFVSVIWAFAQYIGDPGQFADTPPVTFVGRMIACLVGLLGIAIVAVPAGIIGAGFTEAIEDDKKATEIQEDANKLRDVFERKLDRPSGYQTVPPFRSDADVRVMLNMKTDNLNEAVDYGPGFRLINLASTVPAARKPSDRIAIEHFPINRPYGCLIDRGSKVTIIAPSNMTDACIGNFAFYLALIGGFNYISREKGKRAPYRSFYAIKSRDYEENLTEYLEDLEHLLNRPGAWGVTVLVSSGSLEPEYPTHIHVNIGGPKGDTRMSGEDLFVKDGATYSTFYNDLAKTMETEFELKTDHQIHHTTAAANHFVRHIKINDDVNNIIIRVEWDKILWDSRRILICKSMAKTIARNLAKAPMPDIEKTLKSKQIGFDGYDIPSFC